MSFRQEVFTVHEVRQRYLRKCVFQGRSWVFFRKRELLKELASQEIDVLHLHLFIAGLDPICALNKLL